MKGHVPTPAPIVRRMVEKLFAGRAPHSGDVVLDPGCGDGPFIAGVLEHCEKTGAPLPWLLGVESNPDLAEKAAARFAHHRRVGIITADYLQAHIGYATHAVGNPPYVGITRLDGEEKAIYRARFRTAVQRFDLYLLFFEQTLDNLVDGGRLVFITPEKFEYVHTAEPLRRILTTEATVEEIEHVAEDTFDGLVTYSTITTIIKRPPPEGHATRVILRDGTERQIQLPHGGRAWTAAIAGHRETSPAPSDLLTLGELCTRISAGVATGADAIWVRPRAEVDRDYRDFLSYAHPTISGRQLAVETLTDGHAVVKTADYMLIPYDNGGAIVPENELPAQMRAYIHLHSATLRQRTHLQIPQDSQHGDSSRERPLHKFHDSVVLPQIRRPKILFRDITLRPQFWVDRDGTIVPRHTVYYAVPRPGVSLDELVRYLNGPQAALWLQAHCQRAANGFLRLQSRVLRKLPVPSSLRRATAALVDQPIAQIGH